MSDQERDTKKAEQTSRQYGVVIYVDKDDPHPDDDREWAHLDFRDIRETAKMEAFAKKTDPRFSRVRSSSQDVWLN